MRVLHRWTMIALKLLGPGILVCTAALALISAAQAITGNTIGANNTLFTALIVFILAAVAVLLRQEYLVSVHEQWFGNEHARELLAEGIPPFLDTYLRYVSNGDFAVVNRFWAAGIIGGKDTQGRTDLHLACLMGHPALVQELLTRGADPTGTTPEGHTALIMAAAGGNARVIEVLSDHRCALDAGTLRGCSALYSAASRGHAAAVEKLIKLGAKLDRTDDANITPLMAAIAQRHHDVAMILMKAGADIKKKDAAGATLMDYATAFQAPKDLVDYLTAGGVEHSEQGLICSGTGGSWDGHVRLTWERI